MKAWLPLLVLLLVALPAGRPATADDKPAATRPGIFPLAAVRPGMKGHGLTVKQGTHIERFEFEVIDVIRNHIVKEDVILVRCLGEDFADHQIAQGMSGSPCYLDGKLAGALSYTWSWAKHAVGGITPIETMLAEGDRPLEGRATGMQPPTPLRRTAAGSGDGDTLRPIGTPLALGGFSPEGRAALERDLDGLGLTPCGGGSASGGPPAWANLDAKMEPGSALVVDLMRGDYLASALGTCTYVDGDKVYGFGHSFETLGETLLPMSVGYVYTVLASRQISFKLGASIRPVGAIVQDRPACIVGVLGAPARMVPIHLEFRNAVTGRTEGFDFEVTPNRVYFSRLVVAAVRESFGRAESTMGYNTKRYTMTVKIRGMEPWTYTDVIAGFDGGFQRQLTGLLDKPLNHNTQRVEFESFDLKVEVEHRDRRAYVRTVTSSAEQVRPGQHVSLRVGLETKDGGERVERTLEAVVPLDAPEGNYQITVLGGDFVPADVGTPEDVADYPTLYAAFLKSTELVALLPTSRVDLDLDGRLLRNLPLSSLPRIVRAPGGKGGRLRPVTEKVLLEVPYVVADSATVTLRVVR